MIFDSHVHLFHPKIISNVKKREEMVEKLGLQTIGAENRIGVSFLEDELKTNGIGGCLILPTAGVKEVAKVNDSFYRTVEQHDLLYTAGTLHPGYVDNKKELLKFKIILSPKDNLFLDTSNAPHVLKEDQFIYLLKAHGPEHIIFGTDWPWFTHAPEIVLQNRMFAISGYSRQENALVFSKNMEGLLGLIGSINSGL